MCLHCNAKGGRKLTKKRKKKKRKKKEKERKRKEEKKTAIHVSLPGKIHPDIFLKTSELKSQYTNLNVSESSSRHFTDFFFKKHLY